MNINIFSNQNLWGVNRLFVLNYSNIGDNAKRFKARRYYLSKVLSRIITSSLMGKTFMTNQLILI